MGTADTREPIALSATMQFTSSDVPDRRLEAQLSTGIFWLFKYERGKWQIEESIDRQRPITPEEAIETADRLLTAWATLPHNELAEAS